MEDYRALITRGVTKAVPQNQNAHKAFVEQQKKEGTPTEWLERLKRNMRQYSGMDTDTEIGQTLLKVTFVTHAWPDIRKKPERLEDWQDRGLNDVLKEAQKVYVQRDEEKAKAKAKVMAAAIAEGNHCAKTHSYKEVGPQSGQNKGDQEEVKGTRAP